jgi:hypothetical protein
MLVLATVEFSLTIRGSENAGLPNAPDRPSPSAFSSAHFGVRTQRLRYDTRPCSTWNAWTMPSPANQ